MEKDINTNEINEEDIVDTHNTEKDNDSNTQTIKSEEQSTKEQEIANDEKTVPDADNVEEQEANPQTEDSSKKKKKSFKKKDKKDEKIEELSDKYQRLFAEFQNYRSRSEKEKTAMFEVGAKSIIEKILPVVDNFERGIAALSEEDLDSPVGQGMNLIYKQMTKTMEDMGITVIEAQGKEFNPELHNAVMHEDNEELGENIVSQELQKGYKYRDTVIRPSMVKVAN